MQQECRTKIVPVLYIKNKFKISESFSIFPNLHRKEINLLKQLDSKWRPGIYWTGLCLFDLNRLCWWEIGD